MKIKLSDHFTLRRLLRFTLPSMVMMIFTSIYSVVDGFFVSNFAGKTAFAAVNFIMPTLMMLGGVGFMFGTGGSALVAMRLGEKKQMEATVKVPEVKVIGTDGKPQMPTNRKVRVRSLFKSGLAKIVDTVPFTIRLLYENDKRFLEQF